MKPKSYGIRQYGTKRTSKALWCS